MLTGFTLACQWENAHNISGMTQDWVERFLRKPVWLNVSKKMMTNQKSLCKTVICEVFHSERA